MSLIKLNEEDFEYLHGLLDSNIADFDCGAICSLDNEGIPVCCESEAVVPVLYKNEYKYLQKQSDLWRKFKPQSAHDRSLVEDCSYDDVMAVCKGAQNCERNNRSFVCRTFPFYPFIEKNGNFLGLTYNYDFEGKCILVGNPQMVNKEYIKQSMDAWTYVFDRDEEEFDAHYDLARKIERKRRKKGQVIHVITLNGCLEY